MNNSLSRAYPFTKMQSLGNDFVIWDATCHPFTLSREQIKKISNRRLGIGFDQLMVLDAPDSQAVDFNYRIFNADGREVEQCGNGVRCLARFIHRHYLPGQSVLKLGCMNRVVTACIDNESVSVNMGVPDWQLDHIPFIAQKILPRYDLAVDSQIFQIGALSMGNPHAVLQVESVDVIDVAAIGQAISHHKRFPKQVNVGFMQIMDDSIIRLRVYERGVGETAACGTGACAAVAVGCLWGYLRESVAVQLPGGNLQVDWSNPEAPIQLVGSGEFVFNGSIVL